MREREREREREKEREKETSKVGSGGFFYNCQVSQFFLFKYDVEAIWQLMQKTSRAIWANKIDSAQSTQF